MRDSCTFCAPGEGDHCVQLITHMYAQECAHVEKFEHWARTRHVRPTLWHVAGWALGAGTALLGSQAAMACTAAVEHVIDQHYRDQIQ